MELSVDHNAEFRVAAAVAGIFLLPVLSLLALSLPLAAFVVAGFGGLAVTERLIRIIRSSAPTAARLSAVFALIAAWGAVCVANPALRAPGS